MKKNTLHRLRIIAAGALIGFVVTGAFLGWRPSPIDLRILTS